MPADARTPEYQAAVGISWVVQNRGVQVIDEIARRSETLTYPQAAVWELILRGRDPAGAACMTQWIAGIAVEEAQALVARCIGEWTEAGWIQRTDIGNG